MDASQEVVDPRAGLQAGIRTAEIGSFEISDEALMRISREEWDTFYDVMLTEAARRNLELSWAVIPHRHVTIISWRPVDARTVILGEQRASGWASA